MILPYMMPRILLITREQDGSPTFPQIVASAAVWEEVHACNVGGLPAREYRHRSGNCFVFVRVVAVTAPDGRAAAIVVAWVPAASRVGPVPQAVADHFAQLVADGVIVKSWAVTLDVDGALVSTTLANDATAVGVFVKNNWPAQWRKRLPGDSMGDPFAVPPVPPAAPTGAHCIAAVVA